MKQSLWSLAAAASFSIMAAFVKLCSDQLGPFELVFYRSLFGVGMMALFMAKTHKQFATKVWKLHLSRTICSFTAICLWFYTLGQMDFGTNMTLVLMPNNTIITTIKLIAIVTKSTRLMLMIAK